MKLWREGERVPAKRVIILNRASIIDPIYRAVLWADVPAGNQIAYVNPAFSSANYNATPAELQALRNGTVTERLVTANEGGGTQVGPTMAAIQTYFEGLWNTFQTEVTNATLWADAGRFWDNASSWNASPAVPMFATREILEGAPTFVALTPVSAFSASKFQFVLFNGGGISTGQGLVIKIRLLVFIPGIAAVTGVISGPWTVQRRDQPTTAPSGSGGLTPFLLDSSQTMPTGIGGWNAPAVSPAGGTVTTLTAFLPQADEQKLTTLDAPTWAGILAWGGQVIYNHSDIPMTRPLTIRQGQTLEVVQDATGGTGNGRILCVMTIG